MNYPSITTNHVLTAIFFQQVLTTLTTLLRTFTGDPGIPSPSGLTRARWSTDPDALSSLIFPAMSTEERHFEDLAAPLPSETDPRYRYCFETLVLPFYACHSELLMGDSWVIILLIL